MDTPHHPKKRDRSSKRRQRQPGAHGRPRHPAVALTAEGFPAATPDAPPVSRIVSVSDESRARHPWLPPRVIAGSVWRGPNHERVRVDENGNAA